MNSTLIPGLKEHLVAERDRLAAQTVTQSALLSKPGRTGVRLLPSRNWRGFSAIAATVAVLAVAAVFSWAALGRTGSGTPSNQAWAGSALRTADAVPRRLIAERGWRVSDVGEFTTDNGSVTFVNSTRSVEMTWTIDDLKSRLADRATDSDLGDRSGRAGDATATLFHYAGTPDNFAAIWSEADGYTLELRTLEASPGSGRTGFTLATFMATLASIRPATVDEWLTAMPPSIVKPQTQRAAIDAMLKDIPQPPGLDVASLAGTGAVFNRYNLGAHVTGAVTCGWIQQWFVAKSNNDEPALKQAVRAMNSAKGWAILREMQAAGDFPLVVNALAEAMLKTPQGKPAPSELGNYRDALGCHGG